MKSKLTALFLVLAFTCSAQTVKFVTDNLIVVRQTADSIALNAKRHYTFSDEGFIGKSTIYRLQYVNAADKTDTLKVAFSKNTIGANKALEISGTTEYSFYIALGKYSDLFPFWKKFIDKNADTAECSTQMNEFKMNSRNFYLRENDNYFPKWEISMH